MPHVKQKAANGLGSIRKRTTKRKNGKKYEYWEARITVDIDPQTGKQTQKTFTAATQAEVIEKIKTYGLEPIEEKACSDSLRLSAWLSIWQSEYLTSVKPSTAYLYQRDLELYILPQLGRYRLDELTPTIIQKFYNRLLHPTQTIAKPLSPKTVKDIHGVLHQALEQAVQNGELEKNPSNACKLPKITKKEVKPLEETQVLSFLQLIEGHSHEYLYKITLFTGLREGEVLGLTWDCVDFKNGFLTIKQQLRKEQKKGGEYYFSTPKSGKARTLSISPSVVQLFRYQQQKQMLMKAECNDSWINTNLVFTNKYGDRLSYRTVYDCFKRVARKMGRSDLRFHDLRHTYAVISIKNGDDIKTVQNNLGHATASFTLDVYGHVTEQMKRESSGRMEAFIQSISDSR